MALIRARRAVGSRVPFRLVCSVRTPGDLLYADELLRPSVDGVDVTIAYTRRVPRGAAREPGRLSAPELQRWGWPADIEPSVYVCGPTAFVESKADLLVALGHDPDRIRTERFG